MSGGIRFTELDRRPTEMGEISLRRRWDPSLEVEVHEVRLDDEFLMSSLFTVAEVALAALALAEVSGSGLDIVVGGLGLGYTAAAVLDDPRVASLHVVDALAEVIGWHQRGLLPLGARLRDDQRCHLVEGDFFAVVAGGQPFGASSPERLHAILVDIDHTPRHHLRPAHAAFYEEAGLCRLVDRLRPGGVFGLWSDDPPDADFLAVLAEVFDTSVAHVVPFANPYTGGESSNTVYVATAADA